jgi:hypothetical protein
LNLGVTDVELGDRAADERSMLLGFRLAIEHGMAQRRKLYIQPSDPCAVSPSKLASGRRYMTPASHLT